MNKVFKRFALIAGCLCVVATIANATGLVAEGSVLSDVLGWFSLSAGGMLLGVAGVTPNNETIIKGGVEVGDITDGNRPDYVAEDFDTKLIRIKPSEFPIDTITRSIGNKSKCSNMVVPGFELGQRDSLDQVTGSVTAGSSGAAVNIPVGKIGMWQKNDVMVLLDNNGGTATDANGNPITLLITSLGDDGASVNAKLVNEDTALNGSVPDIAESSNIMRTSTAVNERVAQVDAWNSLPGKYSNYCQIHMCQVEETVLHALEAKNTTYNFNIMRDQSLYDMKMGMERANLMGVKGIVTDGDNKKVYLSDGIYSQCPNQLYLPNTAPTNADFCSLAREVFEGNNGADTRIWLAGNGILEHMCKTDLYTKQLEAKKTEIVFGITFQRIETPFGILLVKPMGSLLTGEWANRSIIVDPDYIIRKELEDLQSTELELNKTGQARANAVRVHETYCLLLQNLPVHFKVGIAD